MKFGTVIKMNTAGEGTRYIVRYIGTKEGRDIAAKYEIIDGKEVLRDIFIVLGDKNDKP